MTKLPFALVDCGEPAAVRIEVYSHLKAESLDGVAYVCSTHPQTAVDAITAAGFTTALTRMTRDVQRRCGFVHVFPTGTMAVNHEHPRWCGRDGCDRRREHRSPVVDVDIARHEASIIDVALTQSTRPAAEPLVVLTATDGAASDRVVLSIGQARVLRYRLDALIDTAERGRA
ncbi:hypothetical protein OOJ91_13475 [Micromonospora lupini]|uniref:hypothetical protein n=1 Tax=Micromonospora lupini TaxID=285679 RepID=UPI00224EB873|nr:hypothetical protein [Micromonospora lupini]MCX5066856.1 hypothetical protein [Micromonospora lupini]